MALEEMVLRFRFDTAENELSKFDFLLIFNQMLAILVNW